MDWESGFARSILQRGKNYFKRGKVIGLSKVGNRYTATVLGTEMYNVSLGIEANKIKNMSCTCPYADSGNYCKHMAAVIYAVEAELKGGKQQEKQEKKPVERKQIHPFEDWKNGKYQYFDLEKITKKLVIYDKEWEEAGELLEQNRLERLNFRFGYLNPNVSTAMVGAVGANLPESNSYTDLEVLFDRDKLLTCTCSDRNCPAFRLGNLARGNDREACAHVLALLRAARDHLLTNDVGDSTDFNAKMLLENFRQRRGRSVGSAETNPGSMVTLEPRLSKRMNRLSLSFRIGTERMYILKDMRELVDAVKDRDTLEMGKRLTLNFAKDRFDEPSQQYFEFIRDIVEEERRRTERVIYGNFMNEGIKGDVSLYGPRLDRFFDIAKGSRILCQNQDEDEAKETLREVGEKEPELSLTIWKDMGKDKIFHGIKVKGQVPSVIEGSRSFYSLDSTSLNRLTGENLEAIRPLMDMAQDGEISFSVGRESLSEFYYSVLPELRRRVNIKEPDGAFIEEQLPPEASFVFYLDMRDGLPVCRPEVHYGTAVFSALDQLTGDPMERFRDDYREWEVLELLKEYFGELDSDEKLLWCPDDEDAVYKVLESGVNALLEVGEVQSTDAFRSQKIRRRISLRVGVSVESDLLNLEISSNDIPQKELLELLKSYRKHQKYHRLKNGDFVNLDDTIAQLSEMAEAMRLSPKELIEGKVHLPAYRALYLDKLLEQSEELYTRRDQRFKKLIKEFKTVQDSDFEVPESLREIMRGYQRFGHKWLRTVEQSGFGGILADDMGLGKTLQMISVLLSAKEEGKQGTSLVVCPSSLVYNWLEEFKRFAPELNVGVIVGTQAERADLIEDYQCKDVLITSYDLLKRDVSRYEGKRFLFQVLDEAQYIKTHTTAAAKSVKVIQSTHRFALTGTPIENRLSELWSIFDYLMPGFLYGYDVFRKELEGPIAKKKDENASRRLQRMVSPFILRRLKGDVLRDLPDKLEEVRYARFQGKQQALYDAQVLHMRKMLEEQDEEGTRRNKIQILAELTRIRQICCDPSLVFADYKAESAKREACIDLVKSAIEGEHRILLFSQFTSMLSLLEQDLQREGIEYYEITGATPKQERLELVKKFNEGTVPVFLISLKAGGTGLNLTGADVVIHYDPWWNVAAQNQATDRAHRIGQTRTVSVYKLLAKDSIEEKILNLQQTKQHLADEILSGENGTLGTMSRDELLELLG